MIISLIAAVSSNGVIGRDNDLPWNLPDDSKYFMLTTKGHFVVLGRRNYDSLPIKFKPLPNRTNVVVTRQKNFTAPGCIVVGSVKEAIALARQKGEEEVFIIGGAEIYALGMPMGHRIYLTEIHAHVEGDTSFPAFDHHEWNEVLRRHHPADDRHVYAFDFVVYERK